MHVIAYLLGGSGGMPPSRKFLNFRPSEIASGAFQAICAFEISMLHDEMTRFFVHSTPIALVLIR